MKKLFIFINIVLAIVLGFKIYDLKVKLDKSPPPVKSASMVNVHELVRPVIIKEFALMQIFDTKEQPANIKIDKISRQKHPDGLNEILDKDVILRLKGIIKSEDLSFAVVDLIQKDKRKKKGKSKENQTIKLLKNDSFRGYLIEKIFKNYVELSKTGKKSIRLKIFKPDQN